MADDNKTPDELLLEYSGGACDECGRPGEWSAVESGGLAIVVCRICRTQWPHPLLEVAEIDTTGDFPILPEARNYRGVTGAKPDWVKAALKAQADRERARSVEVARIVIVKRPDQP